MGKARRLAAYEAIDRLEVKGSFLDVGCGRGDVLAYANEIGFCPVSGFDVVPELCIPNVSYGQAHDLPISNNSFNVVTCFDVMEHLLPEDTEQALQEINRVSRDAVILCIANYTSLCNGEDLHINKRPYEEWDELIKDHVEGNVEWIPKFGRTHSETWIIRK